MSERTVMVTGGAGRVGSYAVDYLARTPGIGKVVVADLNEDVGISVVNNALIGTSVLDLFPRVEFVKLDLLNIEQTAKVLESIRPRVILHTATLLSSFNYIDLIRRSIKSYYLAGHSIAKDLVLIHKLMKAVKSSDIDTRVVNLAFPDNTCPVLAKVGLAPTIGAGNAQITAEAARKVVAAKLNVPISNVSVTLIAHHAISVAPLNNVPYYLKIRVAGDDVTAKFDSYKIIEEAKQQVIGTTPGWMAEHSPMTAACAVRIVRGIVNDSGELSLAPALNGIPGCLPVRLNAQGAEVVLPQDLTMQDAMKIFEGGMKADGIERIENDGTVVFTEPTVRLMEDVLHMNWPKMRVDQAEEMAKDFKLAYKRLN